VKEYVPAVVGVPLIDQEGPAFKAKLDESDSPGGRAPVSSDAEAELEFGSFTGEVTLQVSPDVAMAWVYATPIVPDGRVPVTI
jgi:hypothetical protein